MKRYCIIGAGHRGYIMFARKLYDDFKDCAKVTALCDPNTTRMKYYQSTIDKDLRLYTDFDEMLDTEKPDAVIVTTVDGLHAKYIIHALDKGYDVITEKPMTINEQWCMDIFEAQKRNNRKVIVTFNYRFMPYVSKIKELLMQNIVGKVHAVNFEYLLGKPHGSDYLRRWHANMKNSGGMLIHKSTHHFDLVNWLLEDEPVSVTAMGSLDFYGPNGPFRGETCRNCAHTKECEFYFDMRKDPFYNEMYAKAEHEDGYIRDNCVFKDDKDIYDNMSASVRYAGGALLTYSLNLFNPYEGFKMTITGEKGRIEAYELMSGLQSMESKESVRRIEVIPNGEEKIIYRFSDSGGTHGGGDDRLLRMIFRGDVEDRLHQFPTAFDGAKSILIGVCANESIRTGRKVEIKPILDRIREIAGEEKC